MQKGKIFLIQPMNGIPEEEVLNRRLDITKELERKGYEVINSFIEESYPEHCNVVPIWYLGKSLIEMSNCHLVYCLKGWESQTGCVLEHTIATAYDLTILYEE